MLNKFYDLSNMSGTDVKVIISPQIITYLFTTILDLLVRLQLTHPAKSFICPYTIHANSSYAELS
jgi:hypothetical protein